MSHYSKRILIVSVRQDVFIYLRRILSSFFSVFIASEICLEEINQFPLIFFDISVLLKYGFQLLENEIIRKNLNRIVFLNPKNTEKNLQDRVYAVSRRILPFPCAPSIIENFVRNFDSTEDARMFSLDSAGNILNYDTKSELMETLLGNSISMREKKNEILRFSKSDEPVLILGESGTGKSMVARLIHDLSIRKGKSFVPVNCATIKGDLDTSALFGTTNGAYTDAKDTQGYIRKANQGTLFLDNIGSSTLDMQLQLLTFIDTGIIYSVGSDIPQKIDTRLILATNKNIGRQIADGLFSRELYFRIEPNVLVLRPLRDRRDDISSIANFMAEKKKKYLAYTAIRKLEEYDWPGNERQLIKCLGRAIETTPGEVINENNILFAL